MILVPNRTFRNSAPWPQTGARRMRRPSGRNGQWPFCLSFLLRSAMMVRES